MNGIKPIETIYNGYRFRSRLEARWAVFFDAMRIRYEYEYEGYEIKFDDTTLRYLPDFWLPEFNLHAEVKGVQTRGEIPVDDAERMSWMIDFDGPCANGIILLGNIPDPENVFTMTWAVWRWMGEGLAYGFIDHDVPIIECFMAMDYQSAPHSFPANDDIVVTSTMSVEDHIDERLIRALTKARQARFEYGETPTKRRVIS